MKNSQAQLKDNFKLAFILSLVISLLMAFASLAGLLFPGRIYPTYEFREAFFANEVVNLLLGLPIMLVSMWLARGGNLAGLLLWPGAMLYVLYNSIAYLVGMPSGRISFVYMALVLLSAYLIFALLRAIDQDFVGRQLSGFVPAKLTGWVLFVMGSLFILRALGIIVQASIDQVTLPTVEIGVLIADIVLSAIWIAGGVLLLLRQPLGYVGGLGLLFSGSMLFIALIVFLVLGPLLTEVPLVLTDVIVVTTMGMVCFIPFYLYLRGVKSAIK